MKRVFLLLFSCIVLNIYSQDKIWQGSALRGEGKSFNQKGLYALSSILKQGEKFTIKNFSNDKIIEITVKGSLESDDILLVLSPEASDLLGLEGYLPIQAQATKLTSFYETDEFVPLPEDDILLAEVDEFENKENEEKAEIDTYKDSKLLEPDVDKIEEAKKYEEKAEIDDSTVLNTKPFINKEQASYETRKNIYFTPASYKSPDIKVEDDLNSIDIVNNLETDKLYIQNGSFKNTSSLKRALSQLADYNIVIYKTELKGEILYRTLIGPFSSKEEADEVLSEIKKQGYYDNYIRVGYNIENN